jgi:hypothetical protein
VGGCSRIWRPRAARSRSVACCRAKNLNTKFKAVISNISPGVSSRPLLQKHMLLVGGGEGVTSMKWFGWLQQWHVTYADASCCVFDGFTGQLLRHVKDALSFPVPSLSSILAAAPASHAAGGSGSMPGIHVKNGCLALVHALHVVFSAFLFCDA